MSSPTARVRSELEPFQGAVADATDPDSSGDGQRRGALFVRTVPDLDVRALGGKQFDRLGSVSVSGGVHRSFTVVVDRVDVDAEVERQLHRPVGPHRWFPCERRRASGPSGRCRRGAADPRRALRASSMSSKIGVLSGCEERGRARHRRTQVDQPRAGHPRTSGPHRARANSRTRSRLVRRPVRSGGGSASPAGTLRALLIACSAV